MCALNRNTRALVVFAPSLRYRETTRTNKKQDGRGVKESQKQSSRSGKFYTGQKCLLHVVNNDINHKNCPGKKSFSIKEDENSCQPTEKSKINLISQDCGRYRWEWVGTGEGGVGAE